MHRVGRRLRRPTTALLVIAAAVLAGCVTENRPESCDADATTIDLTVAATSMEPNDPAACRGQDVTLLIDADVDGVFHIHGLDDLVPATAVSAGERTTLEFTADRSGQFPVELHPADDPQALDIGILTLHER
jgi:hypothetical protein